MRTLYLRATILIFATLGIVSSAYSQNLETFEKNVTEFTLDNGFTFIIVKRSAAPVVSFVTYVNAGSVNEPYGKSGIAHVFEHMAFKGTHDIGTKDWAQEKPVLASEDSAYQSWFRYSSIENPDSTLLKQKWMAFKKYEGDAQQYVKNNEFAQIVDVNGGVQMNAQTGADQTVYFYSLPENKAELWFSLESDRFKNPVFREFYKEKNVIMEERRMRTDTSPIGRLIEEFLSVAYTASHYGVPTIGWPSDILSTTMADTYKFFNDYYVPSNITFAIVGDVDPVKMKMMAEEYFGTFPKHSHAPLMTTKEPSQRGERRFVMTEKAQPWYLAGYHTVASDNPDAKPLEMLATILSSGRTSILYKKMVEEDQIALNVGAFNGFPGDKYSSLFITYVIPNRGVSMNKIEQVLDKEIQKVKDGNITQEELDRARTNARANLVRSMASNLGLAQELAQIQAQTGSWKNLFKDLDRLNQVTIQDVQRVARKYMVTSNRTVGILQTAVSR